MLCFNVDGSFLKRRIANWVKLVFPLDNTAVFVYDSKGSITAAETRPQHLMVIFPVSLSMTGLRLEPNPNLGKSLKPRSVSELFSYLSSSTPQFVLFTEVLFFTPLNY